MADRNDQKELEQLADFRRECFSHNSAEEFLRFKGESVDDYITVHLSVAYVEAKTDDERIHGTELKLSREAIKEKCRYVTNIDYCGPCIAATGLKRKH